MVKIDCKFSFFSALTLNWNYKNCVSPWKPLKCQVFCSYLISWDDIRKCELGAIVPVDFDKLYKLSAWKEILKNGQNLAEVVAMFEIFLIYYMKKWFWRRQTCKKFVPIDSTCQKSAKIGFLLKPPCIPIII